MKTHRKKTERKGKLPSKWLSWLPGFSEIFSALCLWVGWRMMTDSYDLVVWWVDGRIGHRNRHQQTHFFDVQDDVVHIGLFAFLLGIVFAIYSYTRRTKEDGALVGGGLFLVLTLAVMGLLILGVVIAMRLFGDKSIHLL